MAFREQLGPDTVSSVYIRFAKKMPVTFFLNEANTWPFYLKIPSRLPRTFFSFFFFEFKYKKKNHGEKSFNVSPPNSHLKRRLIQPLPLRVTLKKNNRRTVLHGRNQTAAKTIYFCTISLSPCRLETNTPLMSSSRFPPDVSVLQRKESWS